MSSSLEIERKFLVPDISIVPREDPIEISQGYLTGGSGPAVRVRVASGRDGRSGDIDVKAFVTTKGRRYGAVRRELESEIDPDIGQRLLELCGSLVVHKVRAYVNHDGRQWTVDQFGGRCLGLVIAEIEILSISEDIKIPSWCGREVTDDDRFYNENLARVPQGVQPD